VGFTKVNFKSDKQRKAVMARLRQTKKRVPMNFNYKDEKYKGVRMQFIKDNNIVFARAYGYGIIADGKNKSIALQNAKKEIIYRQRRGHMFK